MSLVDEIVALATRVGAEVKARAPLVSPALTGNPTAPTQSAGTNNTRIATTAYADAKVADAINDGTTTVAPSQNAVFDALALKQPLDSDLTTIAGLTATTDSFIQAKAGAWAARTVAQVKTDLAIKVPNDVNIVAFGKDTTRAAGTGDNPFGVKLKRATTFTEVTFRGATADASGSGVYKIQKNGVDVSGMTATVAFGSQIAGGTVTGT